ncbi:alpha/beta hydrolase family protein [Streptacidiphilus jiangxiensis]|uniref:Chlorophyllase n=1 Tax=Streptacidiphilus jiangxiensis TaxID=235985 RepID=A0A1H7P8N0_STRJI|nr:alpha/beta fold hydrolase [Streptacidiphilus jiangxiensis]SEL31768.1 Chlorophyllase [Streptacidiphilus jiangxiensis]
MTEQNSVVGTAGLPVPILSQSPVTLTVPGRPVDLRLRVTAPATGTDLPVILFSHGHGTSNHLSSLDGYAPLVNLLASRGFLVLQPSHLSSATLRHRVGHLPEAPLFWRSRATDMTHLLDGLAEIERAVPQLAGRVNHGDVAVAGHSLGASTACLLLGARTTDPDTGEVVDLREPRIKQGVVLAAPGRGDVLNGPMAPLVPFARDVDFSTMTTPALVVAGDKDDSRHFTDAGPDWHADPYQLAPGPKTLLTVFGAEHILGGISGYDATETTDENPARVAALAELTASYLLSAFGRDAGAWAATCAHLTDGPDAVGRIDTK